jgi:hypothetical protein
MNVPHFQILAHLLREGASGESHQKFLLHLERGAALSFHHWDILQQTKSALQRDRP